MKAVIQKVTRASVTVDDRVTGEIGDGFLILLGIKKGDATVEADLLADKIACLRIFPDEKGKLNRSLQDVGAGALVISNFTLYADCSSGRRPDFQKAAPYAEANVLYEYFCDRLRRDGIPCQTGEFGADMKVDLLNDGPITIVIETDELK
ncbi:MAG TPA: D-aminoacyl-tRNA deacylase [Clostridia bacterium]|nr:D-aminoacyl-tRNA deacylase [Clostridia bacterium]